MHLVEGDIVRRVAHYNVPSAYIDVLETQTFRPHPKSPIGELIGTKRVVHIADVQTNPAYLEGSPAVVALSDLAGARTFVIVPMLKNAKLVGTIGVYRQEVRPFTDKQVELLSNFAKQAVIAIENTRLLRELRERTDDLSESLEQQTATSEVLKVISSSPGALDPVFQTMLANATRICEANFGMMYRYDNGAFHPAALLNVPTALAKYVENRGSFLPPTGTPLDRLFRTKEVTYTVDETAESNPGVPARLGGARSLVGVPMLKDNELVGAIIIYRQEVRPFTDKQVELVRSFASQAVIAIENARLLKELQERTDNLSKSLQQQTATADVLKVISRSAFDLDTVMDTLTRSARHLCAADGGALFLLNGDVLVCRGVEAVRPADEEFMKANPVPLDEKSHMGHAVLTGKIVNIGDIESKLKLGRFQRATEFKAFLAVPLMREGHGIGVLTLARFQVGEFTPRQVELVQTFADQAVIAVENVRLFNETEEALARQTATADILKVIASSPDNVQPVFQIIADRSNELVNGLSTSVLRLQDDVAHMMAFTRVSPEADAALNAFYPKPLSALHWGETLREGKVFITIDVERIKEKSDKLPEVQRLARLRGWRSVLIVPLLRVGKSIGAISVTRREPGAFAEHHVQLLQTFADQAVIAIGNVGLFDEVQARTADLQELLQQQTATSDVLKVISRSAFELDSVMNTLTQSAADLCKAEISALYLREGDMLVARGVAGVDAGQVDFLRRTPLQIDASTYVGRTFLAGSVRNIADIASETEIGQLKAFGETLGFKSILFVPLMREARSVGIFVLARRRTGHFSQQEIDLVQTFADQAVIAIENVRLFNETQEALARQTATADVLKVIASSPSNLQPVFDAIAERSKALIGAHSTTVVRYIGGMMELASFTPVSPEADAVLRAMFPMQPTAGDPQIEQILRGEITRIADAESELQNLAMRDLARARGWRSRLLVPLRDDTGVIGWISIARKEAGSFAEKDVELLRTFADQAVIAISNVELFQEVEAKTRDLEESLQQQTATADVLKVISRSAFDLQTVLNTLTKSAAKLCDAQKAVHFPARRRRLSFCCELWLPRRLRRVRQTKPNEARAWHDYRSGGLEGRDGPHPRRSCRPGIRRRRLVDARLPNGLGVPMLRDGETDRRDTVFRRTRCRPFTDKQIELVRPSPTRPSSPSRTSACSSEVQERTRELSQSLDDLRTAQDRLIQTEKLASLGQLTAGIAHEIKNPLNFVNNFSALTAELTDELNDLLKPAPLDDKMRGEADELTGMIKDNLQKVVQHGKRANSIVKNMLLHSREGSREHRPADINSLLDESLNLAYHGARAEKGEFNITLQRDFDADAGTIELFPQEITRAFLNLIANGVYAATRRKTEDKEPGFEPTLRATTKNLGTTVEIRIRDNGTGIPAEVREKMFNPFFTTKPAGEGTGLGLSMTHDIIVKQHGGRIDVDTEPGIFTEFIITLPRTTIPPKTAGGTN